MSGHLRRIDSHVHVFLPESHGYASERSYTPGVANVEMLEAHLERIGATRVVIVQPSPYGADNTATLSAVAGLGRDRARAIAAVDPGRTSAEGIAEMIRAGVRGLRANFKTSGVNAAEVARDQIRALDRCLRGTDLVLEIFAPLRLLAGLRDDLAKLGRPIILDHFGGFKTDSETLTEDTEVMLELLHLSNIILKTSGACRATGYTDPAALDPLAPLFLSAARGRTIWGSDWPHTGKSSERANRPLNEIEPFQAIDDVKGLSDLERWANDPVLLDEILWYTPAALFGF